MLDFKSPTILSIEQFNSLSRVDKVVWENDSFQCQITEANDFFTSLIYPVEITDTLLIDKPIIEARDIEVIKDDLNINLPSIESGVLEDTIARPVMEFDHTLTVSNPLISSGVINEVIGYKSLILQQESIIPNNPSILSGTIQEVIVYVNHSVNQETINVNNPIISSGSLT